MMKDIFVDTVWVCEDCMMADQYGYVEQEPDCEPWEELFSREPDGASVTYGLIGGDHTCGLPEGEECECEIMDFSWVECDGCGSKLGGRRYAFGLWNKVETNTEVSQ